MEVLLSMLQLLAQNLGELDEFLALQVGIHRDVALRHCVDDGSDVDWIGASQLEA